MLTVYYLITNPAQFARPLVVRCQHGSIDRDSASVRFRHEWSPQPSTRPSVGSEVQEMRVMIGQIMHPSNSLTTSYVQTFLTTLPLPRP